MNIIGTKLIDELAKRGKQNTIDAEADADKALVAQGTGMGARLDEGEEEVERKRLAEEQDGEANDEEVERKRLAEEQDGGRRRSKRSKRTRKTKRRKSHKPHKKSKKHANTPPKRKNRRSIRRRRR